MNETVSQFIERITKESFDKGYQKAREEVLNELDLIDDIAYDGIHQVINEFDALEGIREKIKSLSNQSQDGRKAINHRVKLSGDKISPEAISEGEDVGENPTPDTQSPQTPLARSQGEKQRRKVSNEEATEKGFVENTSDEDTQSKDKEVQNE